MGRRDQQEHDEQQGTDPPQDGERATGNGGPEAPQVIGTDAPLITKGPAYQSDWTSHPDRTMVVQTNRIREPNEAFNPNFVMVPIESDRSPPDRSGAGDGEGKVKYGEHEKGEPGKGRKNQAGQEGDEAGKRPEQQRSQPAQPPSLTRVLLFSGIVSLVCGVVGAWGYSYFFGSEKSGEQKSSGKSSGSSKGSRSSGSSSSSGGSNSSENSGTGSSGGASSSGGAGFQEGGDVKQGSTSNQKDSATGKLAQAETAWLTAVKELQQARAAEKAARTSEDEKKAILDFLKNTLLSAGHPGGVSLAEAFWNGGQGQNVTLRKAVDATESQVGETFADRPLAEAAVREMLGLAYLSLGDAPQAVRQYERAFAVRQSMQGVSHPDTAACRNQLAIAYRLAGRAAEGARLFDRNPNSPAYASALAVQGSILLRQNKPAEAELKLRACLTLRQKIQPDDWTTFDTKSLLGAALLEQKKFADAEPLLVSGYEGMKARADSIPAEDKSHLKQALDRLITLYVAWGKEEQAMRWRQEREATGGPPH